MGLLQGTQTLTIYHASHFLRRLESSYMCACMRACGCSSTFGIWFRKKRSIFSAILLRVRMQDGERGGIEGKGEIRKRCTCVPLYSTREGQISGRTVTGSCGAPAQSTRLCFALLFLSLHGFLAGDAILGFMEETNRRKTRATTTTTSTTATTEHTGIMLEAMSKGPSPPFPSAFLFKCLSTHILRRHRFSSRCGAWTPM